MNRFHTPVLLKEAIAGLRVVSGERYIDATVGGGGYTFEILKRGGIVLGIDIDEEAIEYVKSEFHIGKELILVQGDFKNISEIARLHGFGRVAGILFDVGVSSHQLESEERGFSYLVDTPLDMRMDKSLKVTAADLVNGLTRKELYELFTKLGQENNSWSISHSIVRARKLKPIRTTRELAHVIEEALGMERGGAKAKALANKRVFQALRIAVNDELNNLRQALPASLSLLKAHGRVVVISFHSLEDRIVKEFGKRAFSQGKLSMVTEKPLVPSPLEVRRNPRARSAKMRIFEKVYHE